MDGVPYFRGRTRIDSALETAANSLFPEGRQSLVPQVLLLITDGRQSNDPGKIDLVDAVRPLRDQSIKVVIHKTMFQRVWKTQDKEECVLPRISLIN